MLKGFGGASKSRNINGSLTNLCLIGGVDCNSGATPDLTIKGGAMIKKALCVKGTIFALNMNIKKDLSIKGNTILCGDIHVKGNLLVDTTITANTINAVQTETRSLLVNGNSICCGDIDIKGKLIVHKDIMVFGNVIAPFINIQGNCVLSSDNTASVCVYPDSFVEITGQTNINGRTNINGNVYPLTSNVFELGNSQFKWKNIVAQDMTVCGNLYAPSFIAPPGPIGPIGPIGPTGPAAANVGIYSCTLQRNQVTSFPTGPNVFIAFNIVVSDVFGMYNNGTQGTNGTAAVIIPVSGNYLITYNMLFGTSNEVVETHINGVSVMRTSTSSALQNAHNCIVYPCLAGQLIKLRCVSGLDTQNNQAAWHFTVTRLS